MKIEKESNIFEYQHKYKKFNNCHQYSRYCRKNKRGRMRARSCCLIHRKQKNQEHFCFVIIYNKSVYLLTIKEKIYK
jgi:hypothetical protein